jgi:hypothetical protein
VSPEIGEVSKMVLADARVPIVKFAWLMPKAFGSAASVTLSLHEGDSVFGTFHAKAPSLSAVWAIVRHVAPLSVEYSSLTPLNLPVQSQ